MKRTALQKWLSSFLVFVLSIGSFGTDALAAVLTLPSQLQVIEEEAFYGTTSLDEVIVPEGTTEIQSLAFADSSLNSIELPESISYIADDAFDGVDELSVNAPEGSYAAEWWKRRQEEEMDASPVEDFEYTLVDGNCVITKYIGKASNVIIPSTIEGCPVTDIDYFAFGRCSTVENVILPDNLSTIGTSAFKYCVNLRNISIPNSVTNIKDSAFQGCTSLASISIPEGISKIELYTFYDCSSLVKATLPESIEAIELFAFYGCSSLKDINIPTNITSIGRSAFQNCSSLVELSIPSGVFFIDFHVFSGCTNLESISLAEGIGSIGMSAFAYCSSLTTLSLPATVTDIQQHAFSECTSLTTVNFSEGLLSIDSSAFYNCNSLTKCSLPRSVQYIGEYAFYNCSSLVNMVIPDGVGSIEKYTFYNCSTLSYISIPESVGTIGDAAFSFCSALTRVDLPNSIWLLSENAFSHCTNLVNISLPYNISTIYPNTFSHCSSLTEINIPDTVEYIGDMAFYECNSLQDFVLPENLNYIGYRAFYNCYQLTTLNLPYNVNAILEETFKGCSNLTSISFSDSMNTIEKKAFYACSSLGRVIIPDGVTTIGDFAFAYCHSLENIEIPHSVAEIGADAFENCYILTIHGEVGSYAETYANENNITFTTDLLTDSEEQPDVEHISGDYEYTITDEKCTITKYLGSDTDVIVPDSIDGYTVSGLEYPGFKGCSSIESILLPDTVEFIAYNCFAGCTSLKTLNYPANIDTCYAWDDTSATLLYHNPNLETIIIPEGITYLNDSGMLHCPSIKYLKVPDSAFGADPSAFKNMISLQALGLPKDFSFALNGSGIPNTCIVYSVAGGTTEKNVALYGLQFSTDPFPGTETEEELVQLSGSVTLADGTPLEDTAVYVFDETDALVGRIYTDANGNWTFDVTKGENYTICFSHIDYTLSVEETLICPTENTVLDTVIATLAEGEGSADVTFTIQCNGKDITEAGVIVGEIVTFNVSAIGATKIRLVADGIAYNEYWLSDSYAVIQRSFSRSGSRSIAFQAYDGTAWGKISDAQILNVAALGTLDTPVIHAVDTQYMGESFTVTWDEVRNASSYTVYLYHHSLVWPSKSDTSVSTTTVPSIEIPGEMLYSSGDYLIEVIASGYNYSQSSASVKFVVEAIRGGVEITYPFEGAIYNVGDTMHVSVTKGTGVKDVYIQVNPLGTNFTPDENGVFYPLAEQFGSYELIPYYSYDGTNYYYDENSSVNVNVAEPSIIQLKQGTNSYYSIRYTNRSFEFTGSVSDPRYTLDLLINGNEMQTISPDENGNFVYSASPLSKSGKYEFSFLPRYNNDTTGHYTAFPIYAVEACEQQTLFAAEMLHMYSRPDTDNKNILPYASEVSILGLYSDTHLYVRSGDFYGFISIDSNLKESVSLSEVEMTITCADALPYTALNSSRTYVVDGEGISSVSATVKLPHNSDITIYGNATGNVFTIEVPVEFVGAYECLIDVMTTSTETVFAEEVFSFYGVDTSYIYSGQECWSSYYQYIEVTPWDSSLTDVEHLDVNECTLNCIGKGENGNLAIISTSPSENTAYFWVYEDEIQFTKNTTKYRALCIINPYTEASYRGDSVEYNFSNIYNALVKNIDDIIIDRALGENYEGIFSAINNILDKSDYNDIAYIYWGGHGSKPSAGNPYFCWSILPLSETSGNYTPFPFNYLYDNICASSIGKLNIIIDSCYSGAFCDLFDSLDRNDPLRDNVAILTATTNDELGLRDSSTVEGGLFVAELAEYICSSSSEVHTLSELANKIRVTALLDVEGKLLHQWHTPTPTIWGNPDRVFFAEDPNAVK